MGGERMIGALAAKLTDKQRQILCEMPRFVEKDELWALHSLRLITTPSNPIVRLYDLGGEVREYFQTQGQPR